MSSSAETVARIAAIVARARRAQASFAAGTQADIDRACLAAARPVMRPADNQHLCQLAVEETELGNVDDKQRKNFRKTLGLLRDIRGQKTVGIVHQDDSRGVIEMARPVGVVAALTPSTNPVATPINKTINALKGGNAIILAPPPAGAKVGATLLAMMQVEFKKIGVPPDIVQMLLPPTKEATTELMRQVDLVVVTGSQRNVRNAYTSGTPAIGVGAGNVAVIIDETANIEDAAKKICASKIFDNATSCSSENHLVIVKDVYQEMLTALRRAGGVLLDNSSKQQLQSQLWENGALNRRLIARPMPVFAERAGLDESVGQAKFVMVEEKGVGSEYPFSGEKLSLVVTLYQVNDFAAAKAQAMALLMHQGAGHSVGIHTTDNDRVLTLGMELPVCRVIVNQAHCFATGGSFDNALPFSLSMGCGTWGGNSISDNLNFRHFINTVRIVNSRPSQEPSVEVLYADYLVGENSL